MSGYSKKMLFITTVLFMFAATLAAHPHVFVETEVKVHFSGSTLDGITVQWTFDEMFSNQVMMACDTNRNGRLEPDEVKKVEEGFFSNLKNHAYFTFIWHNDAQIRQFQIRDFNARAVAGNRVEYTFFIPLNIRISGRTTLKMAFLDDSNFVAYYAPASAISVAGNPPGTVNPQNNRRAQFQVVVGG